MAAPERQAIAQLGPRNGTCWTQPLSTPVTTATGPEMVVFVAPPITYNTVSGAAIQDRLPADNVIENISQVLIVPLAAETADDAATVSFNLYRAGALVGGGPFAGWVTGTNPALATWVEAVVPFFPANTALRPVSSTIPVSATKAVLPLQPGDVITYIATGGTPSVAALVDGH